MSIHFDDYGSFKRKLFIVMMILIVGFGRDFVSTKY